MNSAVKKIAHLSRAMLVAIGLVGSLLLLNAIAQPPTLSGVYLPLLLKSPIGWVVGESVGGYGTIINTIDGGRMWTRQGKVGEIPDVNLSCVAAIDNSYAWVVGGKEGYGVILHTKNGGHNWDSQEIPADSQGYEINGIYALDRDTAWAVGYGGTILHTMNGGKNWTRQGQGTLPNVTYYSIYVSDAMNAWAIGEHEAHNIGTVVRTTNGGDNWEQVPYTLKREIIQKGLIMVHGVDANTVWVVGPAQVSFFTGNVDEPSWADQWTPEMVALLHVNGVYAVDRDYIWLARDQGAIYLSTDGGNNYTHQDSGYSGDEILRISAINRSTAWAVTTFFGYPIGGHVLFTNDGGQTWGSQQTPVNTYWNWVSFVR